METIMVKENGNVIVTSKQVCNVFNEYIVNITKDMSEPDII